MSQNARGLPGNSMAVTEGIRIEVLSQYVPERSSPREDHYFFAYRVRMTNVGEAPARLLSRHWIITDGRCEVRHVRGPGVVGEQPRLEPGEAFEYTSFCPLPTPNGSMRGSYQFVRDSGQAFDAEVATFSLLAPQLLN